MQSIKYQTLKAIAAELNITLPQAKQVRGVITGKIKTAAYKSVTDWCRQCYNEPSVKEKRMVALNEIISGYGVEALQHAEAGCCDAPLCEYVNTGDTYSATIVRLQGGKYVVSTWGDMVEYYERQGYKFN